jgi:alkaline phosphatase
MKHKISLFILMALFIAATGFSQKKKNIILLIGDGMGFNHIEACNNFYGETQTYQNWDTYRVSTYSKEGFYNADSVLTDHTFVTKDYTDSGAAATALATGYKTFKGVIGLNENYYRVKNLSEYAEENGYSSGVVSSVPFSHATPAGFIAHVKSRYQYHDIAIDMLTKSKADVIIGCGNPFYDENGNKRDEAYYKFIPKFLYDNITAGETLFQDENGKDYTVMSADSDKTADKWSFHSSYNDLKEIADGKNVPNRLFSMPKVFSTLQANRESDAFNTQVPSLEILSNAALNVLSKNENGFFLMIEGGAIDWASHDSSYVRSIEETHDFNNAVNSVIKWVEENSNWEETMVLVTADHETGYLVNSSFENSIKNKDGYTFDMSIPDNSQKSYEGLQFLSKGSYGGSKCNHTNQLVPLYVKGMSKDLFKKVLKNYENLSINFDTISNSYYIDNTDIAKVLIEVITSD